MAKDKIEKLADELMSLNPQKSEKLALVIRAKLMPEIQKQAGLLADKQSNPQMAQMGRPMQMNMAPPTARDVAMRGILR